MRPHVVERAYPRLVTSSVEPSELRALLDELAHDARTRLASIEASMTRLRQERSVDVADDEHDPDGATLSGEWAHVVGVQEAARREIAEIDDAVGRWEAGTYGICVDCGRPIPIARLRVRPFAIRCVACAEKAGL
jgi:RNA polymerase-binding transcription factor DksA